MSAMSHVPVVDVVLDGDVLLTLSGLAGTLKLVALRVSSHVLNMTSPVFRSLLAEINVGGEPLKRLPLLVDDGDALFILMHIIHLRNDKLPPRLKAEPLHNLALLSVKYQCVTAVGRATSQWFDRLYNARPPHSNFNALKVIEAAKLLDEPSYFARFTERFVLSQRLDAPVAIQDGGSTTNNLEAQLSNHRVKILSTVRDEIDLVVDSCTLGFPVSAEHHIDYAPGMEPDADDEGKIPGLCWVDRHAAIEFLAALKEQRIWPSTVWPSTLGEVVESIKTLKIPEYDDSDKCDFCEDVKAKFRMSVCLVKDLQAVRLWGVCLDCFNAGGLYDGECRYEHTKPKAKQ